MSNSMTYRNGKRAAEDCPDERLCLLARGGDREAEEQLVIRYFSVVKSCSRPFFLAGGDGEDLIQEGMLGLIKAIRAYDPENGVPFQSYARLCVTRRIYSAVRAAAAAKHKPLNRFRSVEGSFAEEQGEHGQVPDPALRIIDMETHQERRRLLSARLSAFENQVLALYLEGDSYEEIAGAVGRPVKSVDNAIQRIRRKAAGVFPDAGR